MSAFMAESTGTHEVLFMKVDLLFRQSVFVFAANFLNASIYTLASWNFLPRELLLSWFGALVCISFIRIAHWRRWRWVSRTPEVTETEVQRWKRRFDVGVFVSGCLWGAIGLMLTPSTPLIQQVMTIFLLAGMSAGAVSAYSSFLTTIGLFLFPAILPLTVYFLSIGGSSFYAMAAMAVAFLLFMVRMGRNSAEHTNRAIALTVERTSLLAANQEKSLFLAGVSHEIRTPLTAINGFTDLLLRSPSTSDAIKQDLKVIQRHGVHLIALVNDLLDLARVETGHVLIERSWMSPKEQIRDALATVSQVAKTKGIELRMHLAPSAPERIYSDPLRFLQVVINLITNAVKFTHGGFVEVSAFEREHTFFLRVTDSGIGIEPEQVSRLFEPFKRGRAREVRAEQGAGLGLALSLRLAQELGGDLRLVESRIGQGSTFEFFVPCTPIQISDDATVINLPHLSAERIRNLRAKSILVVEDDEDLRELILRALDSVGALVTLCENGQEAIERALARNFDAVLMDIQMPVMNGYQATRELRRSGFSRPIIALTAHASLEDQKKCKAAGCTAYVSKPFRAESLVQALAREL